MKKLREHKFHSRSLIPSSIAKEGDASISSFEDTERIRYRFHEGESVVHLDNIEQKMTVQQIIRRKEVIRGEKLNRIDGILCHWWGEV